MYVCTSQFASKQVSKRLCALYTPNTRLFNINTVLKGITSTLFYVFFIRIVAKSCINKKKVFLKKKTRTNKYTAEYTVCSTHQSIISLRLKQINENAIGTCSKNWIRRVATDDENNMSPYLKFISSDSSTSKNNKNTQQTTKCRQEIPLKVDNVICMCVSGFSVLLFTTKTHCKILFIHNAPHDLVTDFSWRIFARINFNCEYPHFS